MVKIILKTCETLGIVPYHCASQLTSTTAHSIDIDPMVAISFFGGSTHLAIFNAFNTMPIHSTKTF